MIVYVNSECIIRNPDGKLTFVGLPTDPFADCVQRCNDGTASEVDLIALSTLPVFDHDAPEHTALEILAA